MLQTVLRSVRGDLNRELANDFAGAGLGCFYTDNCMIKYYELLRLAW